MHAWLAVGDFAAWAERGVLASVTARGRFLRGFSAGYVAVFAIGEPQFELGAALGHAGTRSGRSGRAGYIAPNRPAACDARAGLTLPRIPSVPKDQVAALHDNRCGRSAALKLSNRYLTKPSLRERRAMQLAVINTLVGVMFVVVCAIAGRIATHQ